MAKKIQKEPLHAKGLEISIYTEDFKDEYISLTDIAKYRNADDPRFIIQIFNRVKFEAVKNEAGYNRFVMTPTKWIEQTGTSISQLQRITGLGKGFIQRT